MQMTTDLKDKTVDELVAIVDKHHAGDIYEADGTDAAKELSRRLEESQKQISILEKMYTVTDSQRSKWCSKYEEAQKQLESTQLIIDVYEKLIADLQKDTW